MDTIIETLRKRPVFICGHPKAGTSLLRAVFDSHPQLIVYPEETIFFRRYLPRAKDLDLEAQLHLAEEHLIHIFKWNTAHPDPSQAGYSDRDYSAVSYEAVQQAMHSLAGQKTQNPGDILSAAVLAYGQVSGQLNHDSRWWVEKSPYNEYFADKIFQWWPEARCIHIVRDPRDNYVSYRRKHPDWSPEFFAANWKRSTQAGLQNRRLYGDERYTILRYEDLTRAPEEYLKTMVNFLGITWDPSLSAPTRAGEQWQGNSMFADQFQSISAAPVARWKEKLAPLDAAVIALANHPEMDSLGYMKPQDWSDPYTPWRKARIRLATWPLRRRLSRFQRD